MQEEEIPSIPDEGSVCGFEGHYGQHEGHFGCMDWETREQQILVERVE